MSDELTFSDFASTADATLLKMIHSATTDTAERRRDLWKMLEQWDARQKLRARAADIISANPRPFE